MTIDTGRLTEIDAVALSAGSHKSLADGACVMELTAYVAGEPWSDHPECASPIIGAFLRSWNDTLPDDDRQMLKAYIPRLVGTRSTDAVESARSWMACDWLVRTFTPAWLRLAGLTEDAAARTGQTVTVWCARGENSGPTDREDGRAWLHDHIEKTAAA